MAYSAAADSWMVTNMGKRISLYDIAGLFCQAFLKTASPDKAVNGFRSCGIWLYDPDIFQPEDFVPAAITEEEMPEGIACVKVHRPPILSG